MVDAGHALRWEGAKMAKSGDDGAEVVRHHMLPCLQDSARGLIEEASIVPHMRRGLLRSTQAVGDNGGQAVVVTFCGSSFALAIQDRTTLKIYTSPTYRAYGAIDFAHVSPGGEVIGTWRYGESE